VLGAASPGGVSISDPGDRFERAADAAAARAASGEPPRSAAASAHAPRGVAATQAAAGPLPVQRMMRLFGHNSNNAKRLKLSSGTWLDLSATPVNGTIHRIEGYKDAYVDASVLKPEHDWINGEYLVGELNSGVDETLARWLREGLVLYRGTAHQHVNFMKLMDTGHMYPVGSGPYPDWDTKNSKWLPFSTNLTTAIQAAITLGGMGPGDNQKFVHGYKKHPLYLVGIVMKHTVPPGGPACVFSSEEVQVPGPIPVTFQHVITGSTALSDLGLGKSDEKMLDLMSEEPTQAEIDEYVKKYGKLRHAS